MPLNQVNSPKNKQAVGFDANSAARINYTNLTEARCWRSLKSFKFRLRLIFSFCGVRLTCNKFRTIVAQTLYSRKKIRFRKSNKKKEIRGKQEIKKNDRKKYRHQKHERMNGEPEKGVTARPAFVNSTPFYLFKERFPGDSMPFVCAPNVRYETTRPIRSSLAA